MENNTKKLSIVITTYNRKEPLLEQLRSLESQGHYTEYTIWISDNHSNYDVKSWVEDNFSKEFVNIINVHSWGVNTGHVFNALYSFTLPQTEWMWLLSDDDITEPNSLDIILNDIKKEENNDVCWMKYSISGGLKPNRECYINNIVDIFKYYTKEKGTGEWIFMSNNVYKLSFLRKYLPDLFEYCGNVQEPEVLPLFAIKREQKKLYLSPNPITNYVPGRPSYSLIWVYSRVGNIFFSGLNLSKKETKAFKQMRFFSGRELMNTLFLVENKTLRFEFLKKIFVAHYSIFSLIGIKCLVFYIYKSIMTDITKGNKI
jgi:glycosyltransferase involved in cell wall biosynthesis